MYHDYKGQETFWKRKKKGKKTMMIEDSFFWFRRNRLVLPGITGEHLFMHITDTHISTVDEQSTPEEREETEKQEALWAVFKENFARGKVPFAQGNDEPYGEPQKISTVAAFEKQLAEAPHIENVRTVTLGNTTLRLMKMRSLVDFAVKWIEANRK